MADARPDHDAMSVDNAEGEKNALVQLLTRCGRVPGGMLVDIHPISFDHYRYEIAPLSAVQTDIDASTHTRRVASNNHCFIEFLEGKYNQQKDWLKMYRIRTEMPSYLHSITASNQYLIHRRIMYLLPDAYPNCTSPGTTCCLAPSYIQSPFSDDSRALIPVYDYRTDPPSPVLSAAEEPEEAYQPAPAPAAAAAPVPVPAGLPPCSSHRHATILSLCQRPDAPISARDHDKDPRIKYPQGFYFTTERSARLALQAARIPLHPRTSATTYRQQAALYDFCVTEVRVFIQFNCASSHTNFLHSLRAVRDAFVRSVDQSIAAAQQ